MTKQAQLDAIFMQKKANIWPLNMFSGKGPTWREVAGFSNGIKLLLVLFNIGVALGFAGGIVWMLFRTTKSSIFLTLILSIFFGLIVWLTVRGTRELVLVVQDGYDKK